MVDSFQVRNNWLEEMSITHLLPAYSYSLGSKFTSWILHSSVIVNEGQMLIISLVRPFYLLHLKPLPPSTPAQGDLGLKFNNVVMISLHLH